MHSRRYLCIKEMVMITLGLLYIVAIGRPSTVQEIQKPASVDLDVLLIRSAEYCRKLESVIFYFVCLEEIEEIVDPTLEVLNPLDTVDNWRWVPPGHAFSAQIMPLRKIRLSYVYDYQCIRANRAIRETRTLLEENGKKKSVPNATLQTSVVVYGNALLAPVSLFGERYQATFNYRIVDKSKIEGRPMLVIEAKPKQGGGEKNNLYGSAWVDPMTGDIWKIAWNESGVGNYDIFEKRGKRFMRRPRLTITTEFTAEKNGIRFPSRLFVEEAYVNDLGRALVRSITKIVYKEFKFFSVEVETR